MYSDSRSTLLLKCLPIGTQSIVCKTKGIDYRVWLLLNSYTLFHMILEIIILKAISLSSFYKWRTWTLMNVEKMMITKQANKRTAVEPKTSWKLKSKFSITLSIAFFLWRLFLFLAVEAAVLKILDISKRIKKKKTYFKEKNVVRSRKEYEFILPFY